MNIINREVIPDVDFPQLAPFLSEVWENPLSVETLHEWHDDFPGGEIRRKYVLVTEDGELIGYSDTTHEIWQPNGRFEIFVAVKPAYRRQGYGSLLYNDGLAFALANNATSLDAEARETCPEGMAFAKKRGFAVDRHMYESKIDLANFSTTPYDGLAEKLEAKGYRFFSLADAGDTLEARRKLYEVNKACVADDPANADDSFTPFEEFSKMFDTSSWFRPEGQLLASIINEAGEDEYVGLSAVGYYEISNSMYNMMTGVMPHHRGQKLAQVLKLQSIQFAKAFGADYILTHNDSENDPMLAINRKLGYVPQPGVYRLIKSKL